MTLPDYNNLPLSRRFLLVTGLFLTATIAIGYLLIIPTIGDIKTIRAEIIDQKIDQANKTEQEGNMARVSAKIEQVEPQLIKFESILINQNRELEFIVTLEGIAKQSGVSQKITLDPGKTKADASFRKVPITITVQGPFPSVFRYFSSLERLPYYLNFQTVQIGGAEGSGKIQAPGAGGPNVTLTLNGFSYWK